MVSATNDLTGKLALDTQGLGQLKQSARTGSPEALRTAATQFEAMFINMMLKSAREATPADGLMDNQQTKTFTTMLDQQLSQNLAKRGVGLADVLIRQLSSQQVNAQALAIGAEQNGQGANTSLDLTSLVPKQAPHSLHGKEQALSPFATGTGAKASASAVPATPGITASGRVQSPHVRGFQEKLGSHADEASRTTGIPAKFMLGQAALETGWGKREIRNADGSSSHNLFGIKAGPGWKGKVATAVTTEYVDGVPRTKVEKFRAYDSYADSFKDYARLITNNPRYEKVLANATDASGFAQGLQRAGYATDPMYAAKLTRIIKHSLA
ncbi:flagellar assembly peptidoglycan hydrolase FlgJ [Massilia cavernae]|uniref:Peptidoglycan hydrolase FlgJ n=1 Tax=Massilia cavernae TaxID=2320864 RepID=A0A418XSK5_9BURK|nr:flagellar assembly peptidoglycan hydrolase FlgJ [Massilia cavernae]RJG15573.1 flagellar assembly peptidoglycan hydrolase FlgJ [Massilia cavernae]